jgi:hypothetical protein
MYFLVLEIAKACVVSMRVSLLRCLERKEIMVWGPGQSEWFEVQDRDRDCDRDRGRDCYRHDRPHFHGLIVLR